MTTSIPFDEHLQRLAAGETLDPETVRELARTPDVLMLGMLADAQRRRRHGTRATYGRVAAVAFDASMTDAVPPAAGEVRLTGSPDSLGPAVDAVRAARTVAGERMVSGVTWSDVERWAAGRPVASVLADLRDAGLDALAALALDAESDPATAVEALTVAGLQPIRLAIDGRAAAGRLELFFLAQSLRERFGSVVTLAPLPMTLSAFRPTTGYEDVKMVALARLAAPAIPTIQVDWLRYGPKLAQVALTFGADDIDGVTASDDAPDGRRRAPLEEIRRNIEAAGFTAVERDGRFAVAS